MRELLKIQEGMDIHLDQRDEELRQLRSQSQSDGAQLATLFLQMQELIPLVESRAEVVGKNLEEINWQFDCHRGEINCLKIREKDAKEETERLKGFIVGAGHEAQVFKNRLDRMEEYICRCGVRKLDLSHLCFSLNFYFLMLLSQFPSMFPLLTYSHSFFSLSADYPRHTR